MFCWSSGRLTAPIRTGFGRSEPRRGFRVISSQMARNSTLRGFEVSGLWGSPRARPRLRFLVEEVIEVLKRFGPVDVKVMPGQQENVEFRLPIELARA